MYVNVVSALCAVHSNEKPLKRKRRRNVHFISPKQRKNKMYNKLYVRSYVCLMVRYVVCFYLIYSFIARKAQMGRPEIMFGRQAGKQAG